MLHVFAGRPRAGSFADAGAALGVDVISVDTLLGGARHDVTRADVQRWLLDLVLDPDLEVVWLGTPCASGSVLWLDGDQPQPRTRGEPDEARGLPQWLADYVRRHNVFIEFTEMLGRAALAAGCTVIVENPPDYGDPEGPFFRWAKRRHCPLWLTTPLRRLAAAEVATWASGCQCELGGDFRKPTTLLALGPRARRVASFGLLRCSHSSHAKVAYGQDAAGRWHSAAAAAYPVPMCAWAVETFFTWIDEGVSAVGYVDSPLARRLTAEALETDAANLAAFEHFVSVCPAAVALLAAEEAAAALAEAADARDNEAPPFEWRAAPWAMPTAWPERLDVIGTPAEEARSAALRYVSRRRAEPESPDVLARQPFADPHPTPSMPAPPLPAAVEWPAGAPPTPAENSYQ